MKKRKWIIAAAVTAALVIWIWWGNTAAEVTQYTLELERLPGAFDGFRIVQVSDLHNACFGGENETLLALLRQARPDVIAITGDLVDSRRTDIPTALAFVREAVKIAPCYYVTGNHEARLAAFSELEQGLTDAGVIVLHSGAVDLEREGQTLRIAGLDDPAFSENWTAELNALGSDDIFTILLSHRPERFSAYCAAGMDLVLTGHAHGGQFRIPWVGGLIAPGQGLFPKYDGGLFTQGRTAMVVSRGLGNSIIPFRINNRPELVAVTLRTGE